MHKLLVSIFVVGILSLQAHVLLVFYPRDRFPALDSISPPRLWPFVDYPMYSKAKYEGNPIHRLRVIGVLDDSTEIQILAEDLGMGHWHFQGFIRALRRGTPPDEIRWFVDSYHQRTERTLRSLRLENHPLAFSREGVAPAPKVVVATVNVDDLPPSAPSGCCGQ